MKILSAQNQRNADLATIEKEPISSLALMERAAERWLETARPLLKYRNITVLVGFGNNGGDGLAIARLLSKSKYHVLVLLAQFDNELSPDCAKNLQMLPAHIPVYKVEKDFDNTLINLTNTVLVDALFGSGLNRPLAAEYAKLVDHINEQKPYCLAVDIPSGLFADKPNVPEHSVLKCQYTLTFQSPKISMLFPENQPFVNEFTVVNIDLDKAYLAEVDSENFFLEESEIAGLLNQRNKFAHKGSFGHAAIMHGNEQTFGAAYLSAQAAFYAGAGYTSVLLSNHEKVVGFTNLMGKALHATNLSTFSICIGPGLGTDDISLEKLNYCLENAKSPMVFDADALNLLAQYPELLTKIPNASVFTPHPKELERLIGKSKNSFEQLLLAKKFAKKHGIILLIKRANTVVIDQNGRAYFNSTGNAGLAKAGSGDVLAGIITAFLAQGYAPIEAAKIGVYIHGLAADMLLKHTSDFSFSPKLIIEQIGKALQKLIG